MTHQEFVHEIQKVLEWPDDTFDESTELKGHDKWDSLGRLATMTFVDEELGLTLSARALDGVQRVEDLVRLTTSKLD